MMTISKRTAIRVVSFLIAGVLVCSGALAQSSMRETQYRRQVENRYQYALADLCDSLSNISISLQKSHYAATPMQISSLAAKLWKEAGTAKSCLSDLPVLDFHLQNTNRFLSQVGSYAMTLSKNVQRNGEITEEERDNLRTLGSYANQMMEGINELKNNFDAGKADLDEIFYAEQNTENTVQTAGFAEVEEGFISYPTLIYDGPFSDHLLQRTPLMLEGKESVSIDQAKEVAAKAFEVPVSELEILSEESGTFSCYRFSSPKGEAAVSKQGGYLIYLLCSKGHGESKFNYDHLSRQAQSFLRGLGYSSLKQTYYETQDGVCTFNFAYTQSDITCYTDLIKVSVSLDEGTVCGFDARGYLTNHKSRELGAPKLSAQDAVAKISSVLKAKNYQMALIPTDGLNEVYCYEFLCEGDEGEQVLVYLNADTGAEEQILILIQDESGSLTR